MPELSAYGCGATTISGDGYINDLDEANGAGYDDNVPPYIARSNGWNDGGGNESHNIRYGYFFAATSQYGGALCRP